MNYINVGVYDLVSKYEQWVDHWSGFRDRMDNQIYSKYF